MHDAPLIATVVSGIVLAFFFGVIANRLRLPPLAGYLLAGVVVGPFTPGFVADGDLAHELAELGVVLLMFGVGLHFSIKDLLAVKNLAIPGAIGQMAAATVLGLLLGLGLGWPMGQALVFGLALSVASTVVLLRALEERNAMDTERGRIAVGWLIVEDLMMVLALVLLPALGGVLKGGDAAAPDTLALVETVGLTIGKVALFVALMLVVGRRLIPWLLAVVARTGSRELFRLSVLAIALGVAFGAAGLFGVSFELGAFFAGMMMAESQLSHDAAEETLPLRDAFAVLFFVSIGMLFNYQVLLTAPLVVLAALAIILVGKSLAALGIVLAFGRPLRTALTIAVSLAQIGEFSFILIGVGVNLQLVSAQAQDVLLAAAILSILLNPLLFMALDRLHPWLDAREARQLAAGAVAAVEPEPAIRVTTGLSGHVVLVGYGRVGRMIGEAMLHDGRPLLVIEQEAERLTALRERGVEVVLGDAHQAEVLATAALERAEALVLAMPDAFEAGEIVRLARRTRPDLPILARAHSDACAAHLKEQGASTVTLGEHELARTMIGRLRQDVGAVAA